MNKNTGKLQDQLIFFYFGILKFSSYTKMNTMKVTVPKYLLMRPLFYVVMATVLSLAVMTSCKSPVAPVQKNQVERLAASINFKCPFMVDVDTRMDSVNILPDSTFQYNYTLVNQDKDKIDIRGLVNYIGPLLEQTMRTSSSMAVHRAHKLRMVFHYRDRNGEVVMQIVLEPEDYL
jgi:hypothetical protein